MPKFCANLTMMFNEVPFLERFGAAAESGFKAVEFLFPYDFAITDIAAQLEQHKLQLILFNLPPGHWDKGERGVACLPDRKDEFRQGLNKALEFAKALNCKRLHCMAGKPGTVPMEMAWPTFIANLRLAAQEAAKLGITVLVEPLNHFDMPGYLISKSSDGMKALDDAQQPNIKLQYDIYHMQRMEGELASTIATLLPCIGHLQIADNPGRHEPGTGEINYSFLFTHLDAIGYNGWLGCEYIPRANTQDGLTWFKKHA